MKHPTDWEQTVDLFDRLGLSYKVDASNPNLLNIDIETRIPFTNDGKHIEAEHLPEALREAG